MSATIETPLIPGPIQGPTREVPQIEAFLLDDYPSLVHLAYLILPPSVSRARRVAAAHAVVQRALPPGLTLPAVEPREFMRRRVVREAARQASRRTALARLGSVLAPTDGLSFRPCATTTDRTAIPRRCARGRRVAIACTLVIGAGILVSLAMS